MRFLGYKCLPTDRNITGDVKNAVIPKTDVGVKFQDRLLAHFTFAGTISMLKTRGLEHIHTHTPLLKCLGQ